MIVNPEWHKPKEKPYFHQISLDCIDKLVECMEGIDIEEMDCDTSFKIERQILEDEFDDPVAQYKPNLSHIDFNTYSILTTTKSKNISPSNKPFMVISTAK